MNVDQGSNNACNKAKYVWLNNIIRMHGLCMLKRVMVKEEVACSTVR